MRILINESHYMRLFEAATLSDIYQKYYTNIPQDDFNKIVSSDPTWNREKPNKMGKYGKWLLNLYTKKRLKIEDLYKAKEYLSVFTKYINVIEVNDINKYKSLPELYGAISEYIENPGTATSKQDAVRKIKEDADKVYEDNKWLIIIPKTREASCYYGKGTQWCTAADSSENYFDRYNSQGRLYININKMTGEKYQFHFETDSFMDSTDSEIDAPICETIGLSDGAIEWYQNNVEDWSKIAEEKYALIYGGYQSEAVTISKNIYDDKWSLYNDDEKIASDLVFDDGMITDYYDKFDEYGYAVFDNYYGLKTLIIYNERYESAYLISARCKNVSFIDSSHVYAGSIISVTYDNNALDIMIVPDEETLYRVSDASIIKKVDALTDSILIVEKTNGLIDLVNIYGNELNDIRLINNTVEYDKEDPQYGYVLDAHGFKIKIDLDSLEEVDE